MQEQQNEYHLGDIGVNEEGVRAVYADGKWCDWINKELVELPGFTPVVIIKG